MRRITWFIGLAVAFGCALSMTAAAQDYGAEIVGDGLLDASEYRIEVPQPGVDRPPNAFGGDWQWIVIHSSRFVPWDNSSNPGYLGNGYITPGSSGDIYWAQVDLPAGAEIITVMWQIYDNTATGHFNGLTLTRYQAARFGTTPDFDMIQSLSTGYGDANGYELLQDLTPFPVTVRAYEDIDGSGGSDFTAYVLTAYTTGSPLGSLGLFGATLVWNRVISPAPGSATFPDVATEFWAFQEIEALAASGITQGYPDGTFKPTANVTRAQMATFLARALGLHWPF